MEDQRSTFRVFEEQRRILKVFHHRRLALQPRVGDLTHLFRVELVPLLVVVALVERDDRVRKDEVDEGVADIALVLIE